MPPVVCSSTRCQHPESEGRVYCRWFTCSYWQCCMWITNAIRSLLPSVLKKLGHWLKICGWWSNFRRFGLVERACRQHTRVSIWRVGNETQQSLLSFINWTFYCELWASHLDRCFVFRTLADLCSGHIHFYGRYSKNQWQDAAATVMWALCALFVLWCAVSPVCHKTSSKLFYHLDDWLELPVCIGKPN